MPRPTLRPTPHPTTFFFSTQPGSNSRSSIIFAMKGRKPICAACRPISSVAVSLNPKCQSADLPRLSDLVDGRKRVWVIYSHDWYTDPEQLIPQALDARMERRTTRPFNGLQVLEYLAANE